MQEERLIAMGMMKVKERRNELCRLQYLDDFYHNWEVLAPGGELVVSWW